MGSQFHPHQPDDDCYGTHCHYHNVDEPARPGDYLTCGECGHIYRTPAALHAARRRTMRPLYLADLRNDITTGRLRDAADAARRLYRLHRTRTKDDADNITYCPLCAHDL